uniref:SCAN box domain-containing protein n=1 Tax=Felis catus TaxID=9685 RepID=A0ABI7ZBS1_FELCA
MQPLNKLMAILKPQSLTLHEQSEALKAHVSWQQESIPVMETCDSEASRQKFRHFQYLDVSGPHEALCQLWKLCLQWLKPEVHTKQQILELLVLEQFLTILPEDIRTWVNLQHPKNSKEVVTLIEDVIGMLKDEETPCKDSVPLQKGSIKEKMEADSLTSNSQRGNFRKPRFSYKGENFWRIIVSWRNYEKTDQKWTPFFRCLDE